MSNFKTSVIQPNEIVKATDLEFAFDSVVNNLSEFTKMIFDSNNSFIIGGKVIPYTGRDLNICVEPLFGLCKGSIIPFEETETIGPFAIIPGSEIRIDIVEVIGVWEEFDQQQRAFQDYDTEIQTYQTINTKKKLKVQVKIKQGEPGIVEAPTTDSGYVKLAEIQVFPNATYILERMIFNVSADIAGQENSSWTTEKTGTYNLDYIANFKKIFRENHNKDGSHKNGSINLLHIKHGVESYNVNGNTLPCAGTEISMNGTTYGNTTSIRDMLANCAAAITNIFNSYKKYGDFQFKGEIAISDILNDAQTALSSALKIGTSKYSNGSRYAYLKLNDIELLKINQDGRITMLNGYSATYSTDLITKSVTDTLSNTISDLNTRITNLENSIDKSIYINSVLARYSVESQFDITAATTTNVTLSGSASIDDVVLTDGNKILVWCQNDPKENGIYIYSQNGSWSRMTTYGYSTPNNLCAKMWRVINGSQNGGHLFYLANDYTSTVQFGSVPINIKKNSFIVNKPKQYNVPLYDKNNNLKSSSAQASDDCLIKADILNFIYPVGTLYWTEDNNFNPNEKFGGTWEKIEDKFIYAKKDAAVGTTGGASTVTLNIGNLPTHSHSFTPSGTVSKHSHTINHGHENDLGVNNGGYHCHEIIKGDGNTNTLYFHSFNNPAYTGSVTSDVLCINAESTNRHKIGMAGNGTCDGLHGHTLKGGITDYSGSSGETQPTFKGSTSNTTYTGGGQSFNILPPYEVARCWKRIA